MKSLAIYLRLSIEDRELKEESNSISNQRKLIYNYINQNLCLQQYPIIEFCDDGCSGSNMDRPAMQEMIKMIKEYHISCIIVKDMSRFSRDYIEMGTYLNQIFPSMGIRFISINDHYDSEKENGNAIGLTTAFQTLLYDLYSKDISIKVKASMENKCANGEYIFGQPPFGYEKSKKIKNAVVVNQTEAKIVQYIFSLALQGKSSTEIAKQLYQEQIPTITQIRHPNKPSMNNHAHSWNPNSVRRILNNRFYLGEMAYGKSVKKFVGSKNSIAVPKREWKIIPNHHEALITEEIFSKAAIFRK